MSRRIIVSVFIVISLLLVAFQYVTGQHRPFPFVAIGDTGCDCSGQKKVAARLIKWHSENPFNVVLMLGDNVYGTMYGFGLKGGNRRLFEDRFDDYYQPLMDRGVKFYATVGNHDAETNNAADMIADKRRFNIAGKYGYYAVTPDVTVDGNPLITFISLNTTRMAAIEDDSDQISWLSKTLSESKATWKVVYFHHPLYTPLGAHGPEVRLRKGLERILAAAGVQIVLAGHNHYYARMKSQQGIVHFVSGGGGRSLKTPEPDEHTVKSAKAYHFMYFEVHPDRVEFQAIPPTGPAIDSGTIRIPDNPTRITTASSK